MLASGAVLGLAGFALLARLDVDPLLRLCGLLVFGLDVLRECRIIWSGLGNFSAFDVAADGAMRLHTRHGAIRPVALCSGSVINSRLAWLRLRDADGRDAALLILRCGAAEQTWQRFQLIWRQADKNFGRLPGS